MKHLLHNFFEFFTLTVIARYIIAKWMADQLAKLLKRIFLKTERDVAIWLHYRNSTFKGKSKK